VKKIEISQEAIDDLRIYIPDIDEKVNQLDVDDLDAFDDFLREIDSIYIRYGIDKNDEPNDIGRKYEAIRDRIFDDNCNW
jgi:hypothetical protein